MPGGLLILEGSRSNSALKELNIGCKVDVKEIMGVDGTFEFKMLGLERVMFLGEAQHYRKFKVATIYEEFDQNNGLGMG